MGNFSLKERRKETVKDYMKVVKNVDLISSVLRRKLN
jgi:hypothetical protein